MTQIVIWNEGYYVLWEGKTYESLETEDLIVSPGDKSRFVKPKFFKV